MPQHKALLIGASEYDDPRIQDLPFVPHDLQRMREALLDRGFQSAEIVESKRGITPNTVNGRIRVFLREAGQGDTLFVLLSGHGQHFEGKDFLIPEDAGFDVHDFASSCIEIGWEKELEDSAAGHVVFLVDACREGIDRDSMAPAGVQPWSRRKIAHALRRKVAYVYACSAPQLALFVRESDTARPGVEGLGTEPGTSFSVFSRAVADVISGDAHAARLREFVGRIQARVDQLHHGYGKPQAPQRVTLVTDTEAGTDGGDFPVLPGPDRRSEAHPWIRGVTRHPVWQHTPDSSARENLQQACIALAGRLAETYENAARALHGDPWHDPALAERTHDRLGFLVGRLPGNETLSPTEAALALLLPLAEQAFWTHEAAQRIGLLASDPAAAGPDHRRFRTFAQGFPRLKRRLSALERDKADSACLSVRHIRWWLFHRWLIQQPDLYTAEMFKALLGDVPEGPDMPPWVADAVSAKRLTRLLREHRNAPFAVRRTASDSSPGSPVPGDHDVIAASTSDEHEVREGLVAALVKAASAMAVDPVDLPEIVVEHLGIRDSVEVESLLVTLRRSDWRVSGLGRSLNAVCTHPAVQIALAEHADRVDALLRGINRSADPALVPLRPLPAYADAGLVRLDSNTPDELSDGIRFQLAEDRVQELLMGEELYGERDLAVRELYQNALDALRYRDCRTQYLRRTGHALSDWEGRIDFGQGVLPDGRPYLECRDNGIGMGIAELKGVFSQGGARFVDLPEYVEEQAAWAELPDPKPVLHPNSRFGIGVLSYFMLADEIVVRTCRMGRDGTPGRLLQVTIAGPGNLFRVEDLGAGEEPGTTVQLLLSRQGAAVSCVDALQQVLWVAPYRTKAAHGSREYAWEAQELSPMGLELQLELRRENRLGDSTLCLSSDDPDIWWIEHYGIVLSDGLYAGVDEHTDAAVPFGVIVNLHGEKTPELTVDRTKIRSFDLEHVQARMTAAAGSLTVPSRGLPNAKWLADASASSIAFGDCVAAHLERAEYPWPMEDVSLSFGSIGFFPPDATLLPLLTGRFPNGDHHRAAAFLLTMPAPVLRWRLRALYHAGLGGTVALGEACPADDLRARPSDLMLCSDRERMFRFPRWDEKIATWLKGTQEMEPYWRKPSQALVRTGAVSLHTLFPWRDTDTPFDRAEVLELSDKCMRSPTEIAERLRTLGYTVESVEDLEEVQYTDLPMLRRLGDLDWLIPGATLSAAQIYLSAVRAECSTEQTAQRLQELGFSVPAEYPARESWTQDEYWLTHRLWLSHTKRPGPEAARQVSRAQLTSVAHLMGWSLRSLVAFLTEMGFLLPENATHLPELTDDDRAVLGYEGEWPPTDAEVPPLYIALAARRAGQPPMAVAARLRALGYDVPAVTDDIPLPSRGESALRLEVGLLESGPLTVQTISRVGYRLNIPLAEVLSRLSSLGYTCTLSPEVLANLTVDDREILYFDSVADPERFAPVTPTQLEAVTRHCEPDDPAEIIRALTGLGLEVLPPSEAWKQDHAYGEILYTELADLPRPSGFLDGSPSVSLVTLAVTALRAGRTLREAALTATELGIRHEAETWFTPAPEEPPVDASAAAAPPQ